jgi:ubiquinone/menaquinone biosynthesis C-methylase UbiE
MPFIDHFGLLAPFYDRFFHAPHDTNWDELLNVSHSHTILDVGGGTGRVSQLISGNGHKIIVLDASMPMLVEAQAKGELQSTCGLSECMPFPTHTFDRILMVDAFHHLGDQATSGCELWRTLKPGGRLVIEEPDIRQFSVKMIAFGEKLLLMRSHFWQAEKIADLFHNLTCQVRIKRLNGSVWIIVDRDPLP